MTGSIVYANQPYFDRLTHNVNKARVARIKISDQFTIDPDQINKIFEDQFTKAGFEVQTVVTIAELQAVLNNSFNFLISFLLTMAVVMAAVGGLGLSGTMSMNVLERVREIGVMRAIGASDGAVLRLVLVEGIIIGLLSWLAGAVVALPLSLVISNVLGNSLLDQPLTYAYSVMGLWLWLIIAIILAAIASFFPARNASQLTVREVLAYE
jgi:putative ABC transport system permease protein